MSVSCAILPGLWKSLKCALADLFLKFCPQLVRRILINRLLRVWWLPTGHLRKLTPYSLSRCASTRERLLFTPQAGRGRDYSLHPSFWCNSNPDGSKRTSHNLTSTCEHHKYSILILPNNSNNIINRSKLVLSVQQPVLRYYSYSYLGFSFPSIWSVLLDTASALFMPSLEKDTVQELPKAISEVVLYHINKDDLAVNTYFFLSFKSDHRIHQRMSVMQISTKTQKPNFCVFLSEGGLAFGQTPSACPTKPHHNLASRLTVSNI